jgi:hypothetical protein
VKKQEKVKYKILYEQISKDIGEDIRETFPLGLSLLFLLGLIIYNEKEDLVEWII